ncbi:MAG TPA: hypothetical protein PLH18_03905 [Clostridia bacterium]|nr:hypothetical protein [Clostridia bacterium]
MDTFGPFILLPIICMVIYYILKKQTDFTKKKKTLLILFAVCFFISEAGRSFYRPYIYENGFFDLYIADTLGSSFGTLTAIFFILLMQGRDRIFDMAYIAGVTIIIMVYEFARLPGNEVFDPKDLYATLIVSALAALVYYFIFLKRTWVEKVKEEEDN